MDIDAENDEEPLGDGLDGDWASRGETAARRRGPGTTHSRRPEDHAASPLLPNTVPRSGHKFEKPTKVSRKI